MSVGGQAASARESFKPVPTCRYSGKCDAEKLGIVCVRAKGKKQKYLGVISSGLR